MSSPSLETSEELDDLVSVGQGDKLQARGWTQGQKTFQLGDARFYDSASSHAITLPSLASSTHDLRPAVRRLWAESQFSFFLFLRSCLLLRSKQVASGWLHTYGSPCPLSPACPGPGPDPAGVFGEVRPKPHPVHVPQLNYRLSFLFCLIPKSICVHTYLIGRLFLLEWGLVLHLSPHCLEGIHHAQGRQVDE